MKVKSPFCRDCRHLLKPNTRHKSKMFNLNFDFTGHQIDPSSKPAVTHTVEFGDDQTRGDHERNAKLAFRNSLSEINVNRNERSALEARLRQDYFMSWHESFDISEFYGFSEKKLDDLLNKITNKFSITGNNVRPKLNEIKWAENVDYRFFEFNFGSVHGGSVYFGMIALAKQKTSAGKSFDSITGLYSLNFQPGRIRHEKRRVKRKFGIEYGSWTEVWHDPVNIGYLTQETVKNFCRAKAMDMFAEKGLLTASKDEL